MRERVALVTGGGRGIGQATALALAGDGLQVVLAAQTGSQLEETVEAVRQRGGVALAVVADISQETAVAHVFERAHTLGPVTVLVNNAATLTAQPFEEVDTPAFDRTLSVNLRGAFLNARRAFADMRAAGGGRIVNMASLSGVAGVEKFPGLAAYVMSKFAIVGLTESLAVEGRPYNIRAVALAPGAVDTQLLRRAQPQVRAAATPDDMARLIMFLLSDAAAPLNGLTIPIFSNVEESVSAGARPESA